MSKHKFKRGDLVKATVDYIDVGGKQVTFIGRTYIVSERYKSEYGHCYIKFIGSDNEAHNLTDSFFRK